MSESKTPIRKQNSYFMYDFTKVTAALPVLLWQRPKVIYENKNARKKICGGALVIANHIGFQDPVIIMTAIWYRRHHFICMKEFMHTKLLATLFTWFHCIPIDRENFNMDSFRAITDHLKNGELVSLFPEGHIEKAEQFASFKSGMVLMALQSKAPIIPIYIHPKKHKYSRMVVVIGEAVTVSQTGEVLPSFTEVIRTSQRLREKEEFLKTLISTKKGS